MMSSVAVDRPSCVPITLHCTAYCGVKHCWRSLSDGLVFTVWGITSINYVIYLSVRNSLKHGNLFGDLTATGIITSNKVLKIT